MKQLLLFLAINFFILNSNAQITTLSAEQQKLEFIRGSWTIDGSEKTYIETCDWIPGNHLQCLATDNEEGNANSSISYLTYSAAEKIYIYYGLHSGGTTRTLRGNWIDDKFILEGQKQTSEKLTKYRVMLKPNQGKVDFLEERSINNGEWKEVANFQYKPAK